MIGPAVLLLAEHTSTARACALLGKPRGSHYRDPPAGADRAGAADATGRTAQRPDRR